MSKIDIRHGENLEIMPTLDAESVDAVVTDPPYGIRFMGKAWDGADIDAMIQRKSRKDTTRSDGYALNEHKAFAAGTYDQSLKGNKAFQVWCEQWATECYRLLKPGGHLLAFGSTRTYHRLVSGIEDAGFEIRDTIAWVFGSGYPKSLNVGKAIDKARDDREEILQVTAWIRERRDEAGISNADIDDAFGFNGMAGHWTSSASQPAVPTIEQVPHLLVVLGVSELPKRMQVLLWELNGRKGKPGVNWFQREVIGKQLYSCPEDLYSIGEGGSERIVQDITAPATPDAAKWDGWGTALKPAFEPIVVARKPLTGTVAQNVLEHGCGALNVDGCRVGTDVRPLIESKSEVSINSYGDGLNGSKAAGTTTNGRWPANLVHDGSDEVLAGFEDSGSAARFFYTAKASRSERNGSTHPTVKPLSLMRWLVRLVCPRGGLILDPFAGIGTTLVAAQEEYVSAIGIEREAEYVETIKRRLEQPMFAFEGEL